MDRDFNDAKRARVYLTCNLRKNRVKRTIMPFNGGLLGMGFLNRRGLNGDILPMYSMPYVVS